MLLMAARLLVVIITVVVRLIVYRATSEMEKVRYN